MKSHKLKRIKIFFKYLPLDILLFFKGIKVKILKSPEELEEAFKFRKKIYLQEGYVNAADVPDIWRDECDDFALNIGAFSNGEVFGVLRLVPQRKEETLPIEKCFNLDEELPENCVEVSKLAIDRNFRGRKRYILYGLIKKSFFWSIKNGKEYWVAFMNDYFCNSLRKFNADVRELKCLPLGESEMANRALMKNYYEKQVIKPYILNLAKILENN